MQNLLVFFLEKKNVDQRILGTVQACITYYTQQAEKMQANSLTDCPNVNIKLIMEPRKYKQNLNYN
jgi:hypothetical protein